MPTGKRHTPEQIVAVLRRVESGETAVAVCRETNISAATFHRWKSQYGGMNLSDLQQLRGLRDENARLKRAKELAAGSDQSAEVRELIG